MVLYMGATHIQINRSFPVEPHSRRFYHFKRNLESDRNGIMNLGSRGLDCCLPFHQGTKKAGYGRAVFLSISFVCGSLFLSPKQTHTL